jgi:TPR repeat protein
MSAAPDQLEAAHQARLAGDEARALDLYRAAGASGDADAQNWTGYYYGNGYGAARDKGEALRWYRMAADQGDATGQANVGVCLMFGTGVDKDPDAAIAWLRKAADQGHGLGQYELAMAYADGRGVPKDDTEAVKWCRLAAAQGRASAQYELGWFHAVGRGVATDEVEALRWFALAAVQGNLKASNWVAYYTETGRGGLVRDEPEAARLYRISADKGEAYARAKLGAMFAEGRGVPHDTAEARHWLGLAVEQGDADARDWLNRLDVAMKPIAQYSPTGVFISGFWRFVQALVCAAATVAGFAWFYGPTDFSHEHSLLLRVPLSLLLILPIGITVFLFWTAFTRVTQAFGYPGYLRAGPEGIEFDLPEKGPHHVPRGEITKLFHYTHTVNGIRNIDALKIRLRDGRELMIESSCFKESIPTIQRRLLDILNL